MTPEEIQALIEAAINNAKAELTESFTKANQGLAASLSKEVKKLSQPVAPVEQEQETESKLTLKALQAEINQLKAEKQAEAQKAFVSQRDAALLDVISSTKATAPQALKKLFLANYQDNIKQENGQWFLEQDDSSLPLSKALSNYLASDEGAHFLPASGVQGSSSSETKTHPSTPKQPQTLDSVLGNLTFEAGPLI